MLLWSDCDGNGAVIIVGEPCHMLIDGMVQAGMMLEDSDCGLFEYYE